MILQETAAKIKIEVAPKRGSTRPLQEKSISELQRIVWEEWKDSNEQEPEVRFEQPKVFEVKKKPDLDQINNEP